MYYNKHRNSFKRGDENLTVVKDGLVKRYYDSHGLLHRDLGPAVIYPDGSHENWKRGVLTASVEIVDGLSHHKYNYTANGIALHERWSKGFTPHRIDGPALIDRSDVSMEIIKEEWYRNGILHRDDGPAQVSSSGVAWWYKGKQYTKEKYFKLIKKKDKMKLLFSEAFINN